MLVVHCNCSCNCNCNCNLVTKSCSRFASYHTSSLRFNLIEGFKQWPEEKNSCPVVGVDWLCFDPKNVKHILTSKL